MRNPFLIPVNPRRLRSGDGVNSFDINVTDNGARLTVGRTSVLMTVAEMRRVSDWLTMAVIDLEAPDA